MSEKLIDRLYKTIEGNYKYIYDIARHIYKNPETGFKEFKTQKYIEAELNKLNITYMTLEGVTGIKVTFDSGKPGPGIAVLGEMDAVICPSHPDSDKESGAVHACGHNVMISNLLGLTKSFNDSGIINELTGKVHFIFVPAEEYVEIDFRCEKIEKKEIKYPTGKAELIHRGFFDNVDICMMIHLMPGSHTIGIESGSNGFIAKKVRYIGKSSHAASAPCNGINALYAANIGLMAINSLRETFKDSSNMRVHPIITKGGDGVNAIPAEVCIETLVRGNNVEDVKNVNYKINRALVGGAVALGAQVEIYDTPGMLPLAVDKNLIDIAENVAEELVGKDQIIHYEPSKGSTDLGDVSSLMPAIEVCIECITGGLHSAEYKIVDENKAYIIGTKMMGGMLVKLFKDNCRLANKCIEEYKPVFGSTKEYFDYIDGLFSKNIYPLSDCMR